MGDAASRAVEDYESEMRDIEQERLRAVSTNPVCDICEYVRYGGRKPTCLSNHRARWLRAGSPKVWQEFLSKLSGDEKRFVYTVATDVFPKLLKKLEVVR